MQTLDTIHSLLNLDEVKIDPSWALKIQPSLAVRRQILPFACVDGVVHVACVNPNDSTALQTVRRLINMPLEVEQAEPSSLKRALNQIYGDQKQKAAVRSKEGSNSDDIVSLTENIITSAVMKQASDIHIDVEKDGVNIRFRVDGKMEPFLHLPFESHAPLISRLKVLSSMDIAEKRSPQDGHIAFPDGNDHPIDIRVATLPTKYGERMTLRVMGAHAASLTLESMAMSEQHEHFIKQSLSQPHGLILLTGPTGSGKTTTLYAALRNLMAKEGLNMITIEDPIEYDLPGVAQVGIDGSDKMDFAGALRSVLRHDPDVVMVGEIRDSETASVAMKAAVTGHLVLSTLHTNSAPSVITRLLDMGVERFLVASTLRLAVAQRLVRKLCKHCRAPYQVSADEATALNSPDLEGKTAYKRKGCKYCAGNGYTGRTGIYEMLQIDESFGKLILDGAQESEIVDEMRKRKMNLLIEDAIEKIISGEVSIAEVLTTTSTL